MVLNMLKRTDCTMPIVHSISLAHKLGGHSFAYRENSEAHRHLASATYKHYVTYIDAIYMCFTNTSAKILTCILKAY